MKIIYLTAVAVILILPLLSSNKSGQQVQYSDKNNLQQSTQSILDEHLHFDIDVARMDITNHWELIPFADFEAMRYKLEAEEIDRLTELPEYFSEMQQRLKMMSRAKRAELLAAMSPEKRNLLKATTLQEYKSAYKAMIAPRPELNAMYKREEPYSYEFHENGIVHKLFKNKDYGSPSSYRWGLNEQRELWMTHDPSAEANGYRTISLNDTERFLVLYINSDSLSLKVKGKLGLEDWEQPRFKTRSSLLGK